MGKLLLTKLRKTVASAIYEDRELLQVNLFPEESTGILGNIYIGRVVNIVKNINAAFVEIDDNVVCYYSLNENRYHIKVKGQQYIPQPLVETNISCGEMIMVQVIKEQMKTKAPVVSCNLNLTGKYGVLYYGKPQIGVSSKIIDKEERERLRGIYSNYITDEYGFVVRTNAQGVSEKEIREELDFLVRTYIDMRQFGIHKTCHTCLYMSPKDYISEIRDLRESEVDEIVTDDIALYQEVTEYLKDEAIKVRFYEDKLISLQNLYGFEQKLKEAVRENVWMKSGAYLVIQPTEALTVIDVNTGKAVDGKRKVEETFFKVNLEAAAMIAKQIRLRNLSGIIIIDFIDMQKEEHKEKLLNVLKECVRKDSVKTTVIDMTALGLVEMTRMKIKKPLHEQLKDNGI